MKELQLKIDPEVEKVFSNYPAEVQHKMLLIRELIIQVAEEIDGLKILEETLKWGEPSYLTKHGSTLRMDWKAKSPDQYALYFKCTSRLVETFRILYKDIFDFEGKRAIVFKMQDSIPEKELKSCIKAALTYHRVKHLKTLGI